MTDTKGNSLPDSVPYTGMLHDVRLKTFVRVTQSGVETKNLAVPVKIMAKPDNSTDWEEVTGCPMMRHQARSRHYHPETAH